MIRTHGPAGYHQKEDVVKQSEHLTRRDFVKKSTATVGAAVGMATLGLPLVKPVLGAAERIRMGFIGLGNRGS